MTRLIVVILASAFVIALLGAAAKIRTSQLKIQEKCRDEFHRNAEHLLSDPETPDSVEHLIISLAKRENSRSFLWSFVLSAIFGQLPDSTGSAAMKMFLTLPSHLRDGYVGAIVAFSIGITYNNILLGPLVRRLMFFSVPRRGGSDIGPCSPVGPMLDRATVPA